MSLNFSDKSQFRHEEQTFTFVHYDPAFIASHLTLISDSSINGTFSSIHHQSVQSYLNDESSNVISRKKFSAESYDGIDIATQLTKA